MQNDSEWNGFPPANWPEIALNPYFGPFWAFLGGLARFSARNVNICGYLGLGHHQSTVNDRSVNQIDKIAPKSMC